MAGCRRIAEIILVVAVATLVGCGGGGSGDSGVRQPVLDEATAESQTPADDEVLQRVVLQTSAGDIALSLDRARAPLTVENFMNYVSAGHYNGTIFHRVIAGFMIQGGGFTGDLTHKSTYDPVANEADNGLQNVRYSIAMARTSDPHSATSQFFINVADNDFLNYSAPTNSAGWGYAVFGQVVDGFDVVDQIAASATTGAGPFSQDVPVTEVTINSVRVD